MEPERRSSKRDSCPSNAAYETGRLVEHRESGAVSPMGMRDPKRTMICRRHGIEYDEDDGCKACWHEYKVSEKESGDNDDRTWDEFLAGGRE